MESPSPRVAAAAPAAAAAHAAAAAAGRPPRAGRPPPAALACVEDGEAEVGGAALFGRHAADHLGAVGDGLLRVEGAVLSGEALADDPRVFVNKHRRRVRLRGGGGAGGRGSGAIGRLALCGPATGLQPRWQASWDRGRRRAAAPPAQPSSSSQPALGRRRQGEVMASLLTSVLISRAALESSSSATFGRLSRLQAVGARVRGRLGGRPCATGRQRRPKVWPALPRQSLKPLHCAGSEAREPVATAAGSAAAVLGCRLGVFGRVMDPGRPLLPIGAAWDRGEAGAGSSISVIYLAWAMACVATFFGGLEESREEGPPPRAATARSPPSLHSSKHPSPSSPPQEQQHLGNGRTGSDHRPRVLGGA